MLLSRSPESKLSPQISGSLIGREDEVVASRGQMTSSEKGSLLTFLLSSMGTTP